MSTHQQMDPQPLYPFNPCGHLRSPGGGCIGVPDVCHRRPATGEKLVELAKRAAELRTRLYYGLPERLQAEDLPGARITIIEKLGSALSLAECLNAMIVSLLDEHAVLTLDDWVSLSRIGGTVARQIDTLKKVLVGWVGMDELCPP